MKSFGKVKLFRYQVFFGIILALSMLGIRCSSDQPQDGQPSELVIAVETIKAEFVPDRRTQIFDFEVNAGGTQLSGRSSNQMAYDRVLGLKSQFPEVNLDSFLYIQPIGSGLINVSVGNIRSKPGHSAELSTQVLMGQEVTIWEQDGYWSYIQTPDEYLGWIDGGALLELDSSELKDYHATEKVMYRTDFGFCYETPDAGSQIVSDLVAGDILQKNGESGRFTEIRLPDGRRAYVLSTEIRSLDDIAHAGIPDWSDIKSTAFQFMGRPYLWGGTSGKGVDCSGFTKMVYYLNGLELPRDASQQVRSGVEIPLDDSLSELEPGDLLFFGYKGKDGQRDRVTHVGIHIGDGRMIHSSQRVQVQSLMPDDPDFAPDRRETLLTAKRMIVDHSPAQGVTPIKNKVSYGF